MLSEANITTVQLDRFVKQFPVEHTCPQFVKCYIASHMLRIDLCWRVNIKQKALINLSI